MLGRALKRISIHSVPQPSSRKRTKAMFSDLTSEKKKRERQIHRQKTEVKSLCYKIHHLEPF